MKDKQIKNTASPPRFIHAPYQSLYLKRRINKAQWHGLFLNIDYSAVQRRSANTNPLDTVSSTVRRQHHQHNQHHLRHCGLDPQSRVRARTKQGRQQDQVKPECKIMFTPLSMKEKS